MKKQIIFLIIVIFFSNGIAFAQNKEIGVDIGYGISDINYTIEPSNYFILWESGHGKIFPEDYMEEFLSDKTENYKSISKWINRSIISNEEICKVLFSNLQDQTPVTNRIVFYRYVNHIKTLLELNPEYVDAYYNRGIAYYGLNKYDEAFKDYGKAIELDPEYVPAYIDRGNAYYGLKKYDEAFKDYDKAIELDPEYVDAYIDRGNAYYGLEKYDEAFKDFDKVIELDPEYVGA